MPGLLELQQTTCNLCHVRLVKVSLPGCRCSSCQTHVSASGRSSRSASTVCPTVALIPLCLNGVPHSTIRAAAAMFHAQYKQSGWHLPKVQSRAARVCTLQQDPGSLSC